MKAIKTFLRVKWEKPHQYPPGFELDNYNYEEAEEFEKILHFHELDETAASEGRECFLNPVGRKLIPPVAKSRKTTGKAGADCSELSPEFLHVLPGNIFFLEYFHPNNFCALVPARMESGFWNLGFVSCLPWRRCCCC